MYPYVPASMAFDDPSCPDTTTIAWIQMLAVARDQISAAFSRLNLGGSAA